MSAIESELCVCVCVCVCVYELVWLHSAEDRVSETVHTRPLVYIYIDGWFSEIILNLLSWRARKTNTL